MSSDESDIFESSLNSNGTNLNISTDYDISSNESSSQSPLNSESSQSSASNPSLEESSIDMAMGTNASNSNTDDEAPNRNSDSSNSTIEYEMSGNSDMTGGIEDSHVIVINDTQRVLENADDDDVILIPQEIETIDLCTQAPPRAFRIAENEVIEIEDSPLTQIRSPREGPSRNNRGRNRNSPYAIPEPKTTSTPNSKRLNFDDSLDATQSIKITCPICLESIAGRQPVSTTCGHLFCKQCIKSALQQTKKCPMCKKSLKPSSVHDIYLGV